MKKETQKKLILKELQRKGSISSWIAILKFRVTRLAAVIYELRQEGHSIRSKRVVREGKNWVEYILEEHDKEKH